MFPWYLIFLKRSLVFPILLFSSISLHCSLKRAFLSLFAILWNSALRWVYLSFSLLAFTSLFSAICEASSVNYFAFLYFFFFGMVLITTSCSVQLLNCVWLTVTPWTAAHQTAAHLSFTNAWSWLKLMSVDFVMPSNHLILCHPLLLPPSIFPSIRIFSYVSVLHIRWPKCWSFSFSMSPSNEYSGLISFRID